LSRATWRACAAWGIKTGILAQSATKDFVAVFPLEAVLVVAQAARPGEQNLPKRDDITESPLTDFRDKIVAIEKYAPNLHRYLLRRLGRSEDVQDLLQIVFMRWWQAPHSQEVRQPEAYLYRIASNVLSEFAVANSKQVVTYDSRTVDELADKLPNTDPNCTDIAERMGTAQQLERILMQIPSTYRTVLLLRTRDGKSIAEIAEQLNISPNTARIYLGRALSACRSADWHR